jgi:hypothetical protein
MSADPFSLNNEVTCCLSRLDNSMVWKKMTAMRTKLMLMGSQGDAEAIH